MSNAWASAPMIAVTYSSSELPALSEAISWQLAFEAISAAGGVPLAIDCATPQPRIAELIAAVDGLLLLGGGDVAPELYGADPDDATVSDVDRVRDDNELRALAEAERLRLPIFAICRGMQILNVARGGTLWVDLVRDAGASGEHRPGLAELVRVCHRVTVEPDSLAGRWMSTAGPLDVNSQHHQGVRDLGRDLRVTARADDGIIEGIESADGLAVGVQWHPEYIWPHNENALALLTGFVARCIRT